VYVRSFNVNAPIRCNSVSPIKKNLWRLIYVHFLARHMYIKNDPHLIIGRYKWTKHMSHRQLDLVLKENIKSYHFSRRIFNYFHGKICYCLHFTISSRKIYSRISRNFSMMNLMSLTGLIKHFGHKRNRNKMWMLTPEH